MSQRDDFPREWKILAALMSAFFIFLAWAFGSKAIEPRPLGTIGKTLQADMLDAFQSAGILPEKVSCSDAAKSDFLSVSCHATTNSTKQLISWFVAAGWSLDGPSEVNRVTLTRAKDGLYVEQIGNEVVVMIRRPKVN